MCCRIRYFAFDFSVLLRSIATRLVFHFSVLLLPVRVEGAIIIDTGARQHSLTMPIYEHMRYHTRCDLPKIHEPAVCLFLFFCFAARSVATRLVFYFSVLLLLPCASRGRQHHRHRHATTRLRDANGGDCGCRCCR